MLLSPYVYKDLAMPEGLNLIQPKMSWINMTQNMNHLFGAKSKHDPLNVKCSVDVAVTISQLSVHLLISLNLVESFQGNPFQIQT